VDSVIEAHLAIAERFPKVPRRIAVTEQLYQLDVVRGHDDDVRPSRPKHGGALLPLARATEMPIDGGSLRGIPG